MYLPCLISIYGTLEYLNTYFGSVGVDLGVVVKQMIRETFGTTLQGNFGTWEGVFGSLKVQLPANFPMTDFDIDRHLHEASLILTDELTTCLPELTPQSQQIRYVYPGDVTVLLYVPVDPAFVQPQFRSKLVPAAAIAFVGEGSAPRSSEAHQVFAVGQGVMRGPGSI